MGDFVDRGFYSVETFLLLLALKVCQNVKQHGLNYPNVWIEIKDIVVFYFI